MRCQDASVFVSSADCRAIVFPNIEEAARVWIKATSSAWGAKQSVYQCIGVWLQSKGSKFSVTELLGSSAAAEPFLRKSGGCLEMSCGRLL